MILMLLIFTNVKRKILIASFLKQVNDIRSYEKIARSLAKDKSYQITCIGYPTKIKSKDKNIELLSLNSFNKTGFGRIIARWQVFKIYVKLKPELIIVNSPDLLLFTVLYKILFGGTIIYDIQENYFKNLWHQNNYHWGIKHALAIIARTKELVTAPLFDHFFLAEKIYASQLKFTKRRSTVLENKSALPKKSKLTPTNFNEPRFIISGTIAKEYGIIEGIDFYKSLQVNEPKSSLVIIGKCANNLLLKELKILEKIDSRITLNISINPIAHSKIEEEILAADFGLLPYLPNQSIDGKWPTKIYEYMGCMLPFIVQENPVWNDFITRNNAGVSFNFLNQSPEKNFKFWETIKSKIFYSEDLPSNIYWETEETKLADVVSGLLNK